MKKEIVFELIEDIENEISLIKEENNEACLEDIQGFQDNNTKAEALIIAERLKDKYDDYYKDIIESDLFEILYSHSILPLSNLDSIINEYIS